MSAELPVAEPSDLRPRRAVLLLVAGTALLRLGLAQHLELSGGECLGWLSARFPAPGAFDDPPLRGYLIWLSTFGATLASPLAVRLFAVLIGAANTIVISRWVGALVSPAAGVYAAVLYTGSFLFAAMGVVLVPETPLCFFWLLTAYCFWKGFHSPLTSTSERRWVLLSGVPLGFAMLCHASAFLILPGVLGYLGSDRVRRGWLRRPEPWIALGFALVIFLPAILWNYEHEWASFRVQGRGFHPLHLLVQCLAPVLYMNPPAFLCIAAGLWAMGTKRLERGAELTLVCWIALPPLAFFAVLSAFSDSRLLLGPGMAYLTLVPIGAAWLDERRAWVPGVIGVGVSLLIGVLAVGLAQLDFGAIDRDAGQRSNAGYAQWGQSDPTTPLIGWHDVESGLRRIIEEDRESGKEKATLLFALRAADAAHLDFSAGAKLGLGAVCLGDPDQERSLAFMRPAAFQAGATGYFVSPSNAFRDPVREGWGSPERPSSRRFASVEGPRIIDVDRRGRIDRRFYVYRCEGLLETPSPPLPARDPMSRIESRLFFRVNRDLRGPLADRLIGYSSWLGVGYVGGPLALLTAVWHWRTHPKRWRKDLVPIVLASLLCSGVVTSVKHLSGRERPPRVFQAAVERGEVDLHVMFGSKFGQGFPSGHTATAFVIATMLSALCRRRGVTVASFALALLVGVSTMYIGAHFPADVAGGALVGVVSGLFAFRWFALPGPIDPR